MNFNNIYYSKDREIIFLSNAKCGCTTIKNSLATNEVPVGVNIHGVIHQSELVFPSHFNAPIFAVTRNPYSRALSCFLDKFKIQKNSALRYMQQLGFTTNQQITFQSFLQRVSELEDLTTVNIHYRPQVYNIHTTDIKPSFVGRMENMDEVAEFLSKYNIELKTRNRHATHSSMTYKDIITEEEAELIRKIYRDDFEAFGYSTDLNSDYIPPAIHQKQKVSSRLDMAVKARDLGLWAKDLKQASKNRESKNPKLAKKYQAAAMLLEKEALPKRQNHSTVV